LPRLLGDVEAGRSSRCRGFMRVAGCHPGVVVVMVFVGHPMVMCLRGLDGKGGPPARVVGRHLGYPCLMAFFIDGV